jgi:predicted  nucleic acid-binding Zn-ribbon protein
MQADIDKHIDKKKSLQHKLEKTRRDFDEIKAMQIEETQRIYYDTQYYKDKVEKLKSELSSLKMVS